MKKKKNVEKISAEQTNTRWLWLYQWDIRLVVYGPLFIGLGLLILIAFISKFVFYTAIPYRLGGFIIGFCSIVTGLGGIPQIIRKEMPGIMWGSKVSGLVPVVSGIVQLVLFSGGGLIVIIATLCENY